MACAAGDTVGGWVGGHYDGRLPSLPPSLCLSVSRLSYVRMYVRLCTTCSVLAMTKLTQYCVMPIEQLTDIEHVIQHAARLTD